MTQSQPLIPPTHPIRHGLLRSSTARVILPSYDRSSLTPAVVHLGVGGFHRAHQAVYFDRLAALGNTDWGVVGVGIRRPEMAEVLMAQDNLFAVIERGPQASKARIVGAIISYLLLSADPKAVLERLEDPRTRLVTLTITADGYRSVAEAGGNHPAVFDVIAQALDNRRRCGRRPFTVLSCDNLRDNAAAARCALLNAADRLDAELSRWIEEHVSFPASMVDRITPSTSPDDRDRIEREFQIADRWPVVTESFAQWVIEDRFCNGRPPLELVDALFVSDVTPYKLIKNRLLNGTHSALGYLGYLAGHRRTDEVMADPILADFIEQLMRNEVVPLLPSGVAGMELSEYCDTVLERLGNPAIGDELSRLCRRGSTKMADYLLPSLATARADGRPAPLLTLAVAGWLRYVRGTDLQGQPIAVTDGRAVELAELEQAGRHDPATLLDSDIFGELAGDRQLSEELAGLIGRIDEVGVRQVIREGLVRS